MGVQFAKRCISTSVVTAYPTLRGLKNNPATVIVQDTETRNATARTAYHRIKIFGSLCKRARLNVVYKKMDSTLRGNLGAELDGILDVFKERTIVLSPTYPEHQRTMVNGNLLVAGTLVENTEFANDVSPVRSSNVKTVVSSQSTREVANIYLKTVRKSPSSIVKSIRRLSSEGIRILCIDAITRADLRNIATACTQINALPCGSAGLAAEIATTLQSQERFLVLSASTNEATMRELRKTVRDSRCYLIKARATDLVRQKSRAHEVSRLRRLTNRALESSRIVIICSALNKSDLSPMLFMKTPLRSRKFRDPIASALAAAMPQDLSTRVSTVLLTGGEMAAVFLKQIQTGGLRLETEILPGIAQGTIVSGKAAGLKVITKAGGFSIPGSMMRLIRYSKMG